jgi:hypothetical protein
MQARQEEEDALFKGFGLVLLSMEKGGVVAISPLGLQDEEEPSSSGPSTVYRLVILTERPRLISELPAAGAPRHVNNTGCKSVDGRVLLAGTVVNISESGAEGGSLSSLMSTSQPEWFDDTVVVAAGNVVVTREFRSGDGGLGGRPQRATKTAAGRVTGTEYVVITAEQHGEILEALAAMHDS